jgi:hypothetical protein
MHISTVEDGVDGGMDDENDENYEERRNEVS